MKFSRALGRTGIANPRGPPEWTMELAEQLNDILDATGRQTQHEGHLAPTVFSFSVVT
jgi:hypothetical protein